jgi:hypothetical protein
LDHSANAASPTGRRGAVTAGPGRASRRPAGQEEGERDERLGGDPGEPRRRRRGALARVAERQVERREEEDHQDRRDNDEPLLDRRELQRPGRRPPREEKAESRHRHEDNEQRDETVPAPAEHCADQQRGERRGEHSKLRDHPATVEDRPRRGSFEDAGRQPQRPRHGEARDEEPNQLTPIPALIHGLRSVHQVSLASAGILAPSARRRAGR